MIGMLYWLWKFVLFIGFMFSVVSCVVFFPDIKADLIMCLFGMLCAFFFVVT